MSKPVPILLSLYHAQMMVAHLDTLLPSLVLAYQSSLYSDRFLLSHWLPQEDTTAPYCVLKAKHSLAFKALQHLALILLFC